MVQSPSWEANWFAASQEIPRISRNPKVHYRTHKRPPPVSILGQPNPVEKYIGKSKRNGNILLLTTKEVTFPLGAIFNVVSLQFHALFVSVHKLSR